MAPAGLALLTLSLGGLLAVAGPQGSRGWVAAGGLVAAGFALAVLGNGPLDAALGAYVGLAAAAFLAAVVWQRTGFLPRATTAILAGLALTAALALVAGGPGWDQLQWAAVREARLAVSGLGDVSPDAAAFVGPVVRAVGQLLPALVVLQSFAGLALAWQWHTRLATTPLGAPLAPFRQFRFGDYWVWALVAVIGVLATPMLARWQTAALNVGVVLGALYVLRGAAIVVEVAAVLGVSTGALTAGAILATVLALPLVFILPSVWTLGVFDTWLEFRRRLSGPATRA